MAASPAGARPASPGAIHGSGSVPSPEERVMIAIFPELSAAAAAADVERLAVLVRRYFGGSEVFSPRPAVKDLVRRVGIDVETFPVNAHGALLAKDERGAFKIVAVVGPDASPDA